MLFWVGLIATLVLREMFHQLSNFILLLLVALFLALAIEPGVNRLAARGWRRGTGTLTILLAAMVFTGVFIGAIGTSWWNFLFSNAIEKIN